MYLPTLIWLRREPSEVLEKMRIFKFKAPLAVAINSGGMVVSTVEELALLGNQNQNGQDAPFPLLHQVLITPGVISERATTFDHREHGMHGVGGKVRITKPKEAGYGKKPGSHGVLGVSDRDFILVTSR
jgi:hypothetical protein